MKTKASKTSSKDRLQKIPVQAYLEPEQAAALKSLSQITRVPQQVYIREAVDLMLAHYQHTSDLFGGKNPPTAVTRPPVLARFVRAADLRIKADKRRGETSRKAK